MQPDCDHGARQVSLPELRAEPTAEVRQRLHADDQTEAGVPRAELDSEEREKASEKRLPIRLAEGDARTAARLPNRGQHAEVVVYVRRNGADERRFPDRILPAQRHHIGEHLHRLRQAEH